MSDPEGQPPLPPIVWIGLAACIGLVICAATPLVILVLYAR